MVHAPPSPTDDGPAPPRRSAPAILLSISALLSLLTKKATQVSQKLRQHHNHKNHERDYYSYYGTPAVDPVKSPRTPRTPLARRPKELWVNMSDKAIKLVHGRKKGGRGAVEDVDEDFGDGGVWQRAILMGDKCQPLDFSGAIYYDENGRKLSHLPIRSPRASPMPGYLGQRNW